MASAWLLWSHIEAERENVLQVETFFFDPSCLSLSVFSSPMLGLSDGGVNKEARSFSRCSTVTVSVSSEFGGEVRLAGWIGVSGFKSTVLIFKNLNRDVKSFFILHLSDVTK